MVEIVTGGKNTGMDADQLKQLTDSLPEIFPSGELSIHGIVSKSQCLTNYRKERDMDKVCYYIDFEFDGPTKKPLTLGIVDSNGHLFYVGFEENRHAVTDPWVAEHVMTLVDKGPIPIQWLSTEEIQEKLFEYFMPDATPHIIADWPSDISYFSELLITGPGTMIGLGGVTFEVVREDAYPSDISAAVKHNALWDAVALRYLLTGKRYLATVTGPVADDFDANTQRYYRPTEICDLLSITKPTLKRWIEKGYFPKSDFQIAGPIWKEDTFKAFLAKCVEDAQK